MRSKLFVPASRSELFAKALASAADALSFNLEDAVAPEHKPQARADLPKPESAAAALEAAERAHGVSAPIGLLLNVESPRALRFAAEMASAHPRVAGLQLGLSDLFEPLGIARRETAAIQQAIFALRVAAGEANVFAYDTAFANIKDTDGFRAEAQMTRAFGFIGKSYIHPSQIALANDVFRPSDDDIAHAVRFVLAARDAQAQGVGAFVVDGRMIDPPFFERARARAGCDAVRSAFGHTTRVARDLKHLKQQE